MGELEENIRSMGTRDLPKLIHENTKNPNRSISDKIE